MLSIITSVHTGNKCMPTQNPFENVLILQLPHVFYFIDYTTFNGIVAKSINIVSTFIWTFMDLFVMIISIGLASRFRLINHSLNKHKGMVRAINCEQFHRKKNSTIPLCRLCPKNFGLSIAFGIEIFAIFAKQLTGKWEP